MSNKKEKDNKTVTTDNEKFALLEDELEKVTGGKPEYPKQRDVV